MASEWIINHSVLFAVILAAGASQGLKIILFLVSKKGFTWKDLIATGSMPSSHTAILASLTTMIFITEGATALAIFSLAMTLIVARDAFGVRRLAGEEAMFLQELSKVHKLIPSPFHFAKGHTPLEVFVGLVIGVFCAVIVYLI